MKEPRLTDFDPNAKVPVLASPLEGYPAITKPAKTEVRTEPATPKAQLTDLPAAPASKSPSDQPRNHDTMTPRYHDTEAMDLIETIRKGVRELGEKAATHRFTREEKAALQDIEYTYRKQYSWQTSENEMTRIAIHWLIEDYRANGENSILHKVLKALKS
jgi:hypothetical protein